jgi:uncharacterized DUF497 family protein
MQAMEAEWDPNKARSNLIKHGVRFVDAADVMEDPRALTMPDGGDDPDRQVALGVDAQGRVLVVVYTWVHDSVRLISARKATPRERAMYEEQP